MTSWSPDREAETSGRDGVCSCCPIVARPGRVIISILNGAVAGVMFGNINISDQ